MISIHEPLREICRLLELDYEHLRVLTITPGAISAEILLLGKDDRIVIDMSSGGPSTETVKRRVRT